MQYFMQSTGRIRKLKPILPRWSLLIIYKHFVRPHLDYRDVIYDQSSNAWFSSNIKSVQFKTALAITGAIQVFSHNKLYQKFGLEYLNQRRWMRRLRFRYNRGTKKPSHIHNLLY